MNKAIMILSLAAVAGAAQAQYASGGTRSETVTETVTEQGHELRSNVAVVREQFAGVEDGKFVVPLRINDGNNAKFEINSDSSRVVVEQDGSHVVVTVDGVEMFNGDLDADFERFTLNSNDGETEIELLNAKGSPGVFVMDRFGGDGNAAQVHIERAMGLAGQAYGVAAQKYALAFADKAHPKVMMGVTLENVGEGLAKQLGVDSERTTQIGSVMEGLPASKAGLEQYDIVVGIDGSPDASPSGIRNAISEKEAGDQLVLDVKREGRLLQVVLDLEAYDGEALGVVDIRRNFAFAPQAMLDPEQAEQQFGEWLEKLVDEREELQESLRSAEGIHLQKLQEQSARLSERIARMREQIAAGDFSVPMHMQFGENAWVMSPDDMDFEFKIDLENMPNVQFAPGVSGSHAFVIPDGSGNAEIKVLVERLEQSAEQNEAQVEQLESRIMELEVMLERAVEELKNSKKGPDA